MKMNFLYLEQEEVYLLKYYFFLMEVSKEKKGRWVQERVKTYETVNSSCRYEFLLCLH